MAKQRLEIELVFDDQGAIIGVKKLKKGVGGVGDETEKTNKQTSKLGKLLKIAAASFIVKKIISGLISVTKKAIDAQETISKFKTVFQDVSKESEKASKNLSRDFGLSGVAAKRLLGDTGDLLTGFGFTGKAALDLSVATNKLAADLASFTNFAGGSEGASKALTKALLGERESVKSLGISILEVDVKKQMAIDRAKGLTFESERQAKAIATLTIAQRQSKNAIGDFARTSQNAANQIRIFKARIEDLQVELGKQLVPIVNIVLKDLRSLTETDEGMKVMANTGKVLATAFVVVRFAVKFLIERLKFMFKVGQAGFELLGTLVKGFVGKFEAVRKVLELSKNLFGELTTKAAEFFTKAKKGAKGLNDSIENKS